MDQNKYQIAIAISDGACNPRAISRELVKAIDSADYASDDPAVRLIASQLMYVLHLWDGVSNPYKMDWFFDRDYCREHSTERL